LFINPSYEFWYDADGQFDFYHFNPVESV
jgi:hypothetical protein